MDQSIASPGSKRVYWTVEDIQHKVRNNPVVVFAKGTPEHPRCGFSAEILSTVESCGKPYEAIDVSKEPSIAVALRAYSGSKSIPAVFVNGDLVTVSQPNDNARAATAVKTRIEEAFSD